MHVMTKVTLGLGTVLFVISSIAFVIGGAELDTALEEVTPNSVGYEYWTGDTSTEFNGELKWSSVYFVFVEEGYEVDVEVSGSGYFESCEEYGDCDDFDIFPGYDYIGDLEVDVSGDYEVDFSETEGRIIDVKITEEEIPVSGLLGAFGGCCGICGALFLLIVGGVMALTLKDQPKVQTSIQFDNDLVVVNENSEVPEYDQDDST